MKVRVKLYASLKEKLGGEIIIEVPSGSLGEAAGEIRKKLEGTEIQALLNGRNAESLPPERKIRKGDVLEAFPPVGGG